MNARVEMLKSSMCVALRIDEIESLLPQHLFSAVDDEILQDEETGSDELHGMTEWSAPWRGRQLSFGLDFRYHPPNHQVDGLWTTLRTNVIVTNESGVDQGLDCLRLCVACMLTRVQWEHAVMAALRIEPLH